MKHEIEKVREFCQKFETEMATDITCASVKLKELNMRLVDEETTETITLGFEANDFIEIVDGIADSLYVTAHAAVTMNLNINQEFKNACDTLLTNAVAKFKLGTEKSDSELAALGLMQVAVVCYGVASMLGLPMQQVFDHVHASNMSKLGQDGKPVKDSGGKVMKGPNFFRPNIANVLNENDYELESDSNVDLVEQRA